MENVAITVAVAVVLSNIIMLLVFAGALQGIIRNAVGKAFQDFKNLQEEEKSENSNDEEVNKSRCGHGDAMQKRLDVHFRYRS